MSNTRKSLPRKQHKAVESAWTFTTTASLGHTFDVEDQEAPIFIDAAHPCMTPDDVTTLPSGEQGVDLACYSCGSAVPHFFRRAGTEIVEHVVLEHATDCAWLNANVGPRRHVRMRRPS